MNGIKIINYLQILYFHSSYSYSFIVQLYLRYIKRGRGGLLFSLVTTGSMLGVLGFSYYKKTNFNNDNDKILKIAENCGLYTKTEKMKLYRRNYNKKGNYTEYVYKIPLGMELEDFKSKIGKFKDGLNNRSVRMIKLKDFKGLTFDSTILKQLEDIIYSRIQLSKEIEMEYDGMLKIRVYEEGLKSEYRFKEEMFKELKKWEVPLGVSLQRVIKIDFDVASHVLIGGATDMGKSNVLNLITTVLLHNNPNDVEFTLIDLKGGLEFSKYEHIKQVKNFATNADQAKEALENVKADMTNTFEFLRSKGFKNVKQAKIKKRHFVIIDEAAELASDGETDKELKKVKIECENLIKDIARRGRASGLKLLYCTQYPTVETVSSQVKRNLIARVCLPVDTATASSVVLDEGGAEKLPLIQGRAIFKRHRKTEMQCYYMDDEIIDKVITPHITFNPRSEESSVSHNFEKKSTSRKYTTIIEKA